MIVSTDIANIIYKDCKDFGIRNLYQSGNIPAGKVTEERIVIITMQQENGTYWKEGIVHVNLCVPDIDENGTANLTRLNELERMANLLGEVNEYDGTWYKYEVDSSRIEDDSPLKCHYVNVRLLFEVLNVN